jgi:hypothetical protein
MVKSVGDSSTSVEEAAARGWVDPFFPIAADGLQIEWLNVAALSPVRD